MVYKTLSLDSLLLGRRQSLFAPDIERNAEHIEKTIRNSSFLVIGGAGSIGSAVVKEIFKRNPKKLHVVDINENALAELVRDIRSSLGYIEGEFKTFVIDFGSDIFENFFKKEGPYDYILNLAALKHVRSEKDPYTLMRMVEVNILNTYKLLKLANKNGTKKVFAVSTDKATNPVNMMGASKRIMELFLLKESKNIEISTARFANVAFSNGSLLCSFKQRMEKFQPIVAPKVIRRYFITHQESGELCLLSTLLGENKDIFFPKTGEELKPIPLTELALKFVRLMGYEPYLCETEEEARKLAPVLPKEGKWAVYFSEADTTGEKDIEQFFTEKDKVDLNRFETIGVMKLTGHTDERLLDGFIKKINALRHSGNWTKSDLVKIFKELVPEFEHKETGKYLDDKM